MLEVTPGYIEKEHDEFVNKLLKSGHTPVEAECYWKIAMAILIRLNGGLICDGKLYT